MKESNDDAFGQALLDCHNGEATHYIIERDDGFMDPGDLRTYFTKFENWSMIEKTMVDFAWGRILDVGCGAGRHSLDLQERHDVVAIDKSFLAAKVAARRGVKEVWPFALEEMPQRPELELFDTIIMMGHNIGLLHSFKEAKRLLAELALITRPNARIIGTSRDVTTNDPDHISYQKQNMDNGRMRGQIRFRIRHRKLVGDWLDYLFVSPGELANLLSDTDWWLDKVVKESPNSDGTSYLAVIRKKY